MKIFNVFSKYGMTIGPKLVFLALILPFSAKAKPHFWDHLKAGKDYLSDEIIVEIFESKDSIHYEHAGKTWNEKVARGTQTSEAIQLIKLATGLGCTLVKKLGTLPFFEFKIPINTDPTRICDAFEENPNLVKIAEPNGILRPAYVPYSFPNDTYYQDGGTQWNLNITQIDKAWNTATGGMSSWSTGITTMTAIAIVDSGINNTHEDLIGQTLTGYSIVDGTTITTDTDGHGTEVASVASVATNNDVGIAGGAIGCKILPVKAYDSGASIPAANLVSGVNWAANNGAAVINMSWGTNTAWAPLQAACDDAYYGLGVVLVNAAGNDGVYETSNYPTAYASVIAVAASDSSDLWKSYSTFGPYTCCVAPSGIETCDIGSNSTYNNWDGTSMSSPGVAGLCAILVSNGVPFYECVSRIATTSDKIDSANYPYGVTTTCGGCLGSWNDHLGYGRINFYRAMETLVAPILNTATPGIGAVSLAWSVPPLFDAPIAGYTIFRATVSGGPYTQVNSILVTSTTYTDVSNQGGFPFYYVIKAVNTYGLATKPSNELSAIPIAPTPTNSPTISPTFTTSPTPTPTATPTSSPTSSVTRTSTRSPTETRSATATWSPSSTFSDTGTPSSTPSPTKTPSNTRTTTDTATPSITETNSHTPTSTQSPSDTATPSETSSFTGSPTSTCSGTITLSPSGTPSASPTSTQSSSFTGTPSVTDTFTASPTFSPSPQFSPTTTPTDSPTSTTSPTDSSTPTATTSFTNSPTETASPTETDTGTPSATPSVTMTASPTASQSPSSTVSPTATPSTTPAPSRSPTPTASPSETSSPPANPQAAQGPNTGPPKIQSAQMVPNPIPGAYCQLLVQLQGQVQEVDVEVFSPGYTLVQRASYPVNGQAHGWVPFPLDARDWPNGLLFVVVRAVSGKESAARTIKAYVAK